MLTTDDLTTLKGYFDPSQHEFLNDMAYIQERAITDRIEQVDPSWEFVRAGDPIYTENQVTIMMALTIKGVTRTNAGTSDLLYKVKKENINGKWTAVDFQRDFDNIKVPANEAVKSATTDALKRCARLFGIGRYLLDMDGVKDTASLQRWLTAQKAKTLQFPTTTPAPTPAPQPQSNGSAALQPAYVPDWFGAAEISFRNYFDIPLDSTTLGMLRKSSWSDFSSKDELWTAMCNLAIERHWALIARKATYAPKPDGSSVITFDTAIKLNWFQGRSKLGGVLSDLSIPEWTPGEHPLPYPVLVTWEQKEGYKVATQFEALKAVAPF